jgi:hypothetical protein
MISNDSNDLTQKEFFNSFNFNEKKKRAKADAQLKALGLTNSDIQREN